MKYLAVLLAILSAGSAWGEEMKRYVPTELQIDFQYVGPNGEVKEQSVTTKAISEPQVSGSTSKQVRPPRTRAYEHRDTTHNKRAGWDLRRT